MSLFDTAITSGAPAPYWFVELFKTIGFSLHIIPVGMLLVGIPLALVLWLFGSMNLRRLAQRLFQQFPIFIALGINFGIVPLLFVQVAYPKLFYTAGILVAWHWIGLLPLLLLAYVTSYLCASGAKHEKFWRTAFWACVSSVCFLAVGLFFSNFWTLFERPFEWEGIRGSSFALDVLGKHISLGGSGTVSGLGYYWNHPMKDPIPYLRMAFAVGLAFYTVAFWIVFDACFVYRGARVLSEDEQIRALEIQEVLESNDDKAARKARRRKLGRAPIQENVEKYPNVVTSVAVALLILGALSAYPSFYEYVVRRLDLGGIEGVSQTKWSILVWGNLVALGIPFLFIVLGKLRVVRNKTLAVCLTCCELFLIGFYATLRQTVQNAQLSPYFNPAALDDPSSVQWTPIFAFLGSLILVLLLIFFMIRAMSSIGVKKSKKSSGSRKASKKANSDGKQDDRSRKSDESKQGVSVSDLRFGTVVPPKRNGISPQGQVGKKRH